MVQGLHVTQSELRPLWTEPQPTPPQPVAQAGAGCLGAHQLLNGEWALDKAGHSLRTAEFALSAQNKLALSITFFLSLGFSSCQRA